MNDFHSDFLLFFLMFQCFMSDVIVLFEFTSLFSLLCFEQSSLGPGGTFTIGRITAGLPGRARLTGIPNRSICTWKTWSTGRALSACNSWISVIARRSHEPGWTQSASLAGRSHRSFASYRAVLARFSWSSILAGSSRLPWVAGCSGLSWEAFLAGKSRSSRHTRLPGSSWLSGGSGKPWGTRRT